MDAKKIARRSLVKSAIIAALSGMSATMVMGAITEQPALASTCVLWDNGMHYNLADGGQLVVPAAGDQTLDTFLRDGKSGRLSPTVPGSTYVLSSGVAVKIGASRAQVTFVGTPKASDIAWRDSWGEGWRDSWRDAWGQSGGWILYSGADFTSFGSVTSFDGQKIDFSDTNGDIKTSLPDGVYALSNPSDTITVSKGMVTSGQAALLCYANGK
jgi:hypothetical protein